ncbi:hypothetical protein [Demequina maris]|uniref:hypothetical protein n=1 Tax=Demequina maris TaxID=1638982 RepID=UPI0007839075|nr:hypothetical protein [Demequina maris]
MAGVRGWFRRWVYHDATATPRYSALWALFLSAVISVGVLGASVYLLGRLATETQDSPEAALSLVFVAAAVVLVLVISALAVVLKRLKLHDASQAMGLPAGSIRAVIALLLIMLFFIAAIFIFNSTQQTADTADVRELTGITQDRYNGIPTELLKEATPRLVDGETVYDVILYPPSRNTATSDDIAKQLVTTVGTLVTAVAAFYFGTATAAHSAQAGALAARRREDDDADDGDGGDAKGDGDASRDDGKHGGSKDDHGGDGGSKTGDGAR